MQLTVKDAAQLLDVPEKAIHRWIRQGVIPVYRANEQLRFNRAELLEWATSRRIHISPDMFLEPRDGGEPSPTLTEALKAGGIVYRLAGSDKQSVLREMVAAMRLPEGIDREFLFEVLLAREMLGSTGIGDGIAIPHVRNPIVLQVMAPMIILCFLEHSIDFDAVDGQPVNILFALISPTVKDHLHILSRVGFVLQDTEFKDALKRCAPPDELLDALARAESRMSGARTNGRND